MFYGSSDHCAQVTEDDVQNLAKVISILTDFRLTRWSRGEKKSRTSLMLSSDICALLTPILLYCSPSVSLVLLKQNQLLMAVPRAISSLITTEDADKTMTNICIRFYTQFLQSKCKQTNLIEDTNDKQTGKPSDTIETEKKVDSSDIIPLSQDLISSYFELHRKIQQNLDENEISTRQEQIKALYTQEWKKLDTLQLKFDNQQLKHDNFSLNEQLSQLRNELQRTQSEKDQFRNENIQMAHEIDRLKLIPLTHLTTQSQQSSNPISLVENKQQTIIDQLQHLSPHEITQEQAKQCIQEIKYRRETFNDHDMKKSICGSLKHLGSDLYSSPVHFLHELIQVIITFLFLLTLIRFSLFFYRMQKITSMMIQLYHVYV